MKKGTINCILIYKNLRELNLSTIEKQNKQKWREQKMLRIRHARAKNADQLFVYMDFLILIDCQISF